MKFVCIECGDPVWVYTTLAPGVAAEMLRATARCDVCLNLVGQAVERMAAMYVPLVLHVWSVSGGGMPLDVRI